MTEKIVYVAKDGTEFEDKYECERYEGMLHGREKVLLLLQGLEDYCQSVHDCHDCIINTLCDRLAYSTDKYGSWYEFTDLINKE